MKRVLLIKFTSLGDLIHALPAITDAALAYPGIQFDWMIDESFSDVARWHPAVNQIFLTSHRVWRKALFRALRPVERLVRQVRKIQYDLVIDGQGNFKTALMSLFMRGPTAGYDRHSAREPIASFAYERKYPASLNSHAIVRLRQLFALSLGYTCPATPPDFGIDRSRFAPVGITLPERYFVFIHNAGWKTKLWPEEHGKSLVEGIVKRGYSVLLPWGNSEEKARAERLAVQPMAMVLPKLSLSQMGRLLEGASGCISMDTGLSHLAAALGIPSVTLYGATDSGLIGASGQNQLHLQSSLPCAPCNRKKCRLPHSGLTPPCLAAIRPERVLDELFKSLF